MALRAGLVGLVVAGLVSSALPAEAGPVVSAGAGRVDATASVGSVLASRSFGAAATSASIAASEVSEDDPLVGVPVEEARDAVEAAAAEELAAVGAVDEGVYSTSTHLGEGEYQLEIFEDPQRRPEGDGFIDLDEDLASDDGVVSASNVLVPVEFSGDDDDVMSFDLDGAPIVITAPGLDLDSPTLEADESVLYEDVATDVDFRYRVSTGEVKEEIILGSGDVPRRYRFVIEDPDGRLGEVSQTADGGWTFSGTGAEEQALLTLPPAIAYELDEAGERILDTSPDTNVSAHMEVHPIEGGFEVESWVDEAWLVGRSFPIALDPTHQFAWGRPGWGTVGGHPVTHHWWYKKYAGSCPTGNPATCAASGDNGVLYVGSDVSTGVDNRAFRSVISWDYSEAMAHEQASGGFMLPERGKVLNAQLHLNYATCLASPYVLPVNTNCGPGTGVKPLEVRRLIGPWSLSSTWAALDAVTSTTASTTVASNGHNKLFVPPVYAWPPTWTPYLKTSSWQHLEIADVVQGWLNDPAYGAGLVLKATDESAGDRGAGWYNTSWSEADRRPFFRLQWEVEAPQDAPGNLTGTSTGSTVHASWDETTLGTWAPTYQTMLVNASTGLTVAASDLIDVGASMDPTTWDFDGVAAGSYYLTAVATNAGGPSPWAQSAPFSVGTPDVEGSSSTTGFEPWWTFEQFPLGPQATASVNVGNGNLVVAQTDGTAVQGRGRLGYVVRRTYNSQSPSSIGLVPSGPAAGWTYNVSAAGDLGGAGGLVVPPDPSALASLPVTLVDRDGTRHQFEPRSTSANVLVGTGDGSTFSLTAGLEDLVGGLLGDGGDATTALTSMVELANSSVAGLGSTPISLPTIGVCVDTTYGAPRGVHSSLWRFVAVDLGESCASLAPGQGPNNGDPLVLGYGVMRPDRVRQLYAITGQLLADVDPAGNELRYGYQLSGPAGLTVGRLSAIWEPDSCSGDPSAVPADPAAATCRAFRFVYGTGSIVITDPAGRTITHVIDAARRLRSATTKDPAGAVLESWGYGYQDVNGESCGGPAGTLCSVTAPNGETTRFTYNGTKVATVADRHEATNENTPSQAALTTAFTYSTAVTDSVRGNRARRYAGIDADLRVEELTEGNPSQVASGTGVARRTTWNWDSDIPGDVCRPADNTPDHHLCSMTQYAGALDTATAPPGYSAPVDQVSSYTYNPEGQVLSQAVAMGGGTPLVTRYGYSAAYWLPGTSSTTPPDRADDPLDGPSQPRPTGDWLYTVSDQVAVRDPAGRTTTTDVDADYTAAPGTQGADCGTRNRAGATVPTANAGNTGLVCHQRRPDATVISNTYGPFGQKATTTSPRGNTTTYHYLPDGALDLSGSVDADGWLAAVEDPNAKFVAFGYDAAGNVARTWDRNATTGKTRAQYPGTLAAPQAGYSETRYRTGTAAEAFDKPWRWAILEADQTGAAVTTTRDTHGNPTVTRSRRGTQAGTAIYDVTQGFNARDQLVSKTTPTTPANPWRWRWDAFGTQIAATDPNGAVTVTVYDDAGRAVETRRSRGPWADASPAEATQCRVSDTSDTPIPAGRTVCSTAVAYDGLNRSIAATDAAGATTWATYDPAGRTTATWAPRGTGEWLHARTVYDPAGNVAVSCPPREADEGSATTCDTDAKYSTSYTYDTLNRPTQVSRWREATSASTGAITGWEPLSTVTDYDGDGNPVRVTDPRVVPVDTDWDNLGRRAETRTRRSPTEINVTQYRYDPAGNTTAMIAGAGSPAEATTAYSYDPAFRLADVVSAATSVTAASATPTNAGSVQNLRTRRLYDADGNLVGLYEARAFSSGTLADPDERYLTRVDYDRDARPIAEWRPYWDDGVTGAARLYDDPNVRDVEEECAKTGTVHKPHIVTGVPAYPTTAGICVTRVGYDPAGRLSTIRTGLGALVTAAGTGGTNAVDPTATYAAPNRFVTNIYTDDGLLAEVQQPNPAATVDNSHPAEAGLAAQKRVRVQVNDYDGPGRAVSTLDAADWQIDRTYTADGLVAVEAGHPRTTATEESRVTNAYNHAGQTVAAATLIGPAETETAPTTYYADGTTYQAADAAGNATRYRYDPAGNPTEVWTPNALAQVAANTAGAPAVSVFTDDNLLASTTQPVAPDASVKRQTSYLYDALGRTLDRRDREVNAANVAISGRDAGSLTSTWNDAGWIATHTRRGGSGTITYQYDAAGHGTAQTDVAAATGTTTSFYLNGQIRSEQDVVPGQTTKTVGYRRYGDGREFTRGLYTTLPATIDMFSATLTGDAGEVLQTFGNGWGHAYAAWTNTYDRAGRMTSTVDPANRRTDQTNNPDGTIASVTHRTGPTGSTIAAGWTYSYDGLNRVTNTTHQVGNVTSTPWTYDYNNAGRLTTWNDGANTKAYTYDPDGNRLTTPTDTSTYRPDGSIKTVTPNAGTTTTYGYSPAGGVATDGCSTNTYDGYDRLTTTTSTCPTNTTSYTYLPDNRQATRTTGTTVTRNRWAAGTLLTEDTTNTLTTARYLTAPQGTLAVSNAATTPTITHIKTDGQSNTALLQPATGTNTTCATSYDPWGTRTPIGTAPTCTNTNTINNTWYRNAPRDPTTGTYQWGNRTYNPTTGTWLTPDTYQAPQASNDLSITTDPLTTNRYNYVNGDPINYVDPSGHRACDSPRNCERPASPTAGPASARRPVNYRDAESSSLEFEISTRRGAGQVRIGLFIASRRAGVGLLAGSGDDRTFDTRAHPDRHRAYVTLDFESGIGRVTANPSCNAQMTACNDARDFSSKFGIASRWPQRLPVVGNPKNRFRAEDSDGGIVLQFELINSDFPRGSPAISGKIELVEVGEGRFVLTDLDRDSYPSLEIYQDLPSSNGTLTRKILRQRETSIYNLLPPLPQASDPADEVAPGPYGQPAYGGASA